MEFEPLDEFEKELRQGLQRRPAPPGLKRKLMERRRFQQAGRRRHHSLLWMRLAASVLIVVAIGGAAQWQLRKVEEKRRGDEARRQVEIALRIANRALNEVNTRLSAHDRETGE